MVYLSQVKSTSGLHAQLYWYFCKRFNLVFNRFSGPPIFLIKNESISSAIYFFIKKGKYEKIQEHNFLALLIGLASSSSSLLSLPFSGTKNSKVTRLTPSQFITFLFNSGITKHYTWLNFFCTLIILITPKHKTQDQVVFFFLQYYFFGKKSKQSLKKCTTTKEKVARKSFFGTLGVFCDSSVSLCKPSSYVYPYSYHHLSRPSCDLLL